MNELRQPTRPSDSPQAAIVSNTSKALDFVARTSRGGQKIQVDTLALIGQENSNIITMTLQNLNDLNSVIIPFGTPLGSLTEALLLPNLNATIPSENRLATFIAASELNDGINDTAPQLRLMLERFLRQDVIVQGFEVITDDTTLGAQQRVKRAKHVIVPMQSSDARSVVPVGVPLYTEFTGTQVLSQALVCGDFSGFLYELLPLATVTFNMYVSVNDSNLTIK